MRGRGCLCGQCFPDWLAESEIECKELADEKLGFGEIAEERRAHVWIWGVCPRLWRGGHDVWTSDGEELVRMASGRNMMDWRF